MADGRTPRPAFAPWDRRTLPGLFDVEESARRVGAYAWLEMRLFEALGGWIATVPELDVKMILGRHCYHHAWHAELMDKRLPELREMNTERLCEPANEHIAAFVELSPMLVTALNPHIGYDKAARIAKHAIVNDLTLKKAAADLKLVSEDDFDRWLRPEEMLGPRGG